MSDCPPDICARDSGDDSFSERSCDSDDGKNHQEDGKLFENQVFVQELIHRSLKCFNANNNHKQNLTFTKGKTLTNI